MTVLAGGESRNKATYIQHAIEMELPILLPGGAVSPAIKAATGFALGPCTDRERERQSSHSVSVTKSSF